MVEQALHYALGVVPAMAYAVVRRRAPVVAAAGGLLFGAILWAINDEVLSTALGLAGPPEAYPVESHARGLIGHLTLGAATDTVLELLPG
jgi:uncharacterized membrane protein YagU involved in acid resistance